MIVLCSNPECGAVLRVGFEPGPTAAVMRADSQGDYFSCPRCKVRNPVSPRTDDPPDPDLARQPEA